MFLVAVIVLCQSQTNKVCTVITIQFDGTPDLWLSFDAKSWTQITHPTNFYSNIIGYRGKDTNQQNWLYTTSKFQVLIENK